MDVPKPTDLDTDSGGVTNGRRDASIDRTGFFIHRTEDLCAVIERVSTRRKRFFLDRREQVSERDTPFNMENHT